MHLLCIALHRAFASWFCIQTLTTHFFSSLFFLCLFFCFFLFHTPSIKQVLLQSAPDESPYVCQVHEVWRELKTGESYLRGVWFYRREDLPSDVIVPKMNEGIKNRLFLSGEKFVNSAETILAKALVIYSTDDDVSQTFKKDLSADIEDERQEQLIKYNVEVGKIVSV